MVKEKDVVLIFSELSSCACLSIASECGEGKESVVLHSTNFV